jgi:AcrR family transcriptional regulator
MARVDIVRRAQFGLRLRAKSHAQLIRAARGLFATRPVDSITVDDVTREAELAKGTFYVHFQHLDDLRAAVADELARELDDLLQPHRTAIADPVERIATGCAAFIRQDKRCTIRHGEDSPGGGSGRSRRLPPPHASDSATTCVPR